MGLIKWQHEYDRERTAYLVLFPNPLPLENVHALLHAVSTSLQRSMFDGLTGRQTIVFEAWAAGTGLTYRLLIPWQVADQITSEFRHLIPGTVLTEDESRPRLAWDDVAEVSLSDKTRTINTSYPQVVATDLLTSLSQAMHEKETALIQWIIAPAPLTTPPSRDEPVTSTRNGLLSLILNQTASREEVEDRRKKLEQATFQLQGRLAARAKTPARAQHLVDGMFKALKTANGPASFQASKGGNMDLLRDRINFATTPTFMPAVLNVTEASIILGLPIGSPSVPGLPRTMARPLYATEEVPRSGRHLGMSNFPGSKRPIAQTYDSPTHTYVGGKTGHGKSVLLANSAAQDMARGHGVIIIDASDSNSPETLFNRALNYIPAERLNDVIIVDIAANADRPIGVNLLDQGDPDMVVSQIGTLIEQLYSDSKGVWTQALLYHGMKALIEHGNTSIIDLLPLLRPRPEEVPWQRSVLKSIKNKQIKYFMDDYMALKEDERIRRSQPLYDRLWQLNNRPEVHNILGQSKSAFNLRDVLANNKILFINLAGLPQDTASLIGTSLFQKLWEQARRITPGKPNFVYLDEVQYMTRIDVGLDQIMAIGRKQNFFLTTATQHLHKREDISERTRMAIVNNTGTKILFTSSADEAKYWLPEFGGRLITDTEITGLKRFDAIARIDTKTSPGDPVTFTAAPPFKPNGTAELAKKMSAEKYGTPLDQVEQDVESRRRTTSDDSSERPAMGRRKIDSSV